MNKSNTGVNPSDWSAVKVGRYQNIKGGQPVDLGDVTLSEAIQSIRTGPEERIRYVEEIRSLTEKQSAVDLVRNELPAGHPDRIKLNHDWDRLDKQRKELKWLMPSFTFPATFLGGRKKDRIRSTTGLIYLDVDMKRIKDGRPDDWFAILRSRPEFVAGWKSVSGTGYGVLVAFSGLYSRQDPLHYDGAWAAYLKFLQDTVDVPNGYSRSDWSDVIDGNAKSVNQVCFRSYDPSAELEPFATPIRLEVVRKERIVRARTVVAESGQERYLQHISNGGSPVLEVFFETTPVVTVPTRMDWHWFKNRWFHFKVGYRAKSMAYQCQIFLYNNYGVCYDRFEMEMLRCNNTLLGECEPLPIQEVKDICRKAWGRPIELFGGRLKRTAFPRGYTKSASERRKVAARLKIERIDATVIEAVRTELMIDPEATKKRVAAVTGIDVRKVSRVWDVVGGNSITRKTPASDSLLSMAEHVARIGHLPTQRVLASSTGLSLKTVKRHWSSLKELINTNTQDVTGEQGKVLELGGAEKERGADQVHLRKYDAGGEGDSDTEHHTAPLLMDRFRTIGPTAPDAVKDPTHAIFTPDPTQMDDPLGGLDLDMPGLGVRPVHRARVTSYRKDHSKEGEREDPLF